MLDSFYQEGASKAEETNFTKRSFLTGKKDCGISQAENWNIHLWGNSWEDGTHGFSRTWIVLSMFETSMVPKWKENGVAALLTSQNGFVFSPLEMTTDTFSCIFIWFAKLCDFDSCKHLLRNVHSARSSGKLLLFQTLWNFTKKGRLFRHDTPSSQIQIDVFEDFFLFFTVFWATWANIGSVNGHPRNESVLIEQEDSRRTLFRSRIWTGFESFF